MFKNIKMKSPLPYFLDFPKDFQKQIVEKIITIVSKSENVQLVGLKGSGKSLIFRAIPNLSYIVSKFDICNIDLSLISEKTPKAISEFLLNKLTEWESKENSFKRKTIILVDSFENIEDMSFSITSIFNGISNRYRDFISFVFSVERPIESNNRYWGKAILCPPLNETDYDWFWMGLGGKKEFKEIIYKISGGYMAIVKRLFEIVNSGGDLNEIIKNPRLNPHLLYQLELMKEGLKGRENYFDVPLYETFIKGTITNKELTASENRAFQFLISNKGVIIERDSLIKAIWGEHASVGIADHALDQIIHRLKSKIEKDGYKLETIRGRGHRLQKSGD